MRRTAVIAALLLGGCVYAESPYGRYAAIDLPVTTQSTVHKTVTVNAPAGTTVILNESPPPDCYGTYRIRSRGCR